MTHIPVSHLPFGGGTEGTTIMKKTYIEPTLKIEETQVACMLSESLLKNDETEVDGADFLTKEKAGSVWSTPESIWDKAW